MHIASSLRDLSLGLVTASLAFAGAAWAQPSPSTQTMHQQQVRYWKLVGVNARLDHNLSTRNAHQGQTVEARLNGAVKTASGMKLPRGTQLWGEVESVHASTNRGPATLSLVFTKAKLKSGREIPVKVTVLGAYPSDEAQLAVMGSQTMPPAPRHISSKERIDQEAGLLSHISLHSAVQANNSATFRDRKGNFKLNSGTFLQVGIQPTTSRG